MLETYHGGCHCGRVRFRIRADLGTIGECNCSICTKKGILHLPVALADLLHRGSPRGGFLSSLPTFWQPA
jgi:hypothetical protein